MRTTISISDDLLKKAKKESVERGCTLGEVIEEALTLSLIARRSEEKIRQPFQFTTYGEGGTFPGVDTTSNAALADLMDSP